MANSKNGKHKKFVHKGEKRKATESEHPHLKKNENEILVIHKTLKIK